MSDNGDDTIDYNGYPVDEQSQIILRLLADGGEQTAGTLAERTGLGDTSAVHYRVDNYIGTTAAGLVERSGRKERNGDQSDEVKYALTDEGRQFVDAHQNQLIDVVSAAEAVETLARIRARIEEFEERVSEAEKLVEANDRWQNRWGTRVNRIETALDELEETVDENGKAKYNFLEGKRREATGEHDTVADRLSAIESTLGGLSQQVTGLDERLNDTESALDERVTERELEDTVEPMEERLSADIKMAREKAEGGLF